MCYLGIDWGEKRWGISYADEIGIATPQDAIIDSSIEDKWQKLEFLISNKKIETIVVGYPYNMDGSVGFKAKEVDGFIESLEERHPKIPVHRVDERLTSHVAGMSRSAKEKRKERKSGKLDSSSATIILQDYIDQHISIDIGEIDLTSESEWR